MFKVFSFIIMFNGLIFNIGSEKIIQDEMAVFDGYPIPTDKHMLFYIQKNFNTNTVVYTANIGENGKLDPKEPVKVFWRRFQEDGRIRELKFLEKTLGYGINFKPMKGKENTYIFSLVSIKTLKLVVTQDAKGKPHIATIINKKPAKIKRVFVTAEHKKLIPKIFSVEVFGTDLKTGDFLYEKIKQSN